MLDEHGGLLAGRADAMARATGDNLDRPDIWGLHQRVVQLRAESRAHSVRRLGSSNCASGLSSGRLCGWLGLDPRLYVAEASEGRSAGPQLGRPARGAAGAHPGRPAGSLGLRKAFRRQVQSSAEAEFAEAASVIDVGLLHPGTDKYLLDH